MGKKAGILLPLFIFFALSSFAVQEDYQPSQLVSVVRKLRTRVLYYQVNTPVEREDPYYEISVQSHGTTYIGEFTPRNQEDTPPDSWKSGESVQARFEKHYMFLKQPGGRDMKLLVVKRTAATSSGK